MVGKMLLFDGVAVIQFGLLALVASSFYSDVVALLFQLIQVHLVTRLLQQLGVDNPTYHL